MQAPVFQLAQLNIAQLLAPLDSPLLSEFVAALAPLNALADRSPGFAWRLQTEGGDATAIRGFGDDRLIVNMSTWESLDALSAYVYHGEHTAIMRQRRRWFAQVRELYMVLWWVPAGHQPSVAEAEQRLAYLQAHGPTPHAFSFRAPFAPPGSQVRIVARETDRCTV